MGYRSEVAYIVKVESQCLPFKDKKDVFNMFMAELKARDEAQLALKDFDTGQYDSGGIDYDNYAIKFFASHVKWYDDFEDVKSHHFIMDVAREWNEQYKSNFVNGDGFLFSIGFVRVGEDNGDIEDTHEGRGYEYVGVSQIVTYDWE